MKYFFLIICLILSGCAMPHKLCSSVDKPTPLEQVELTIHEESIWMSSYHCHVLAFKRNPLMLIAAFGTMPACADVSYSVSRRAVTECEVWTPKGIEWMREHELRHCMGYRDSLF